MTIEIEDILLILERFLFSLCLFVCWDMVLEYTLPEGAVIGISVHKETPGRSLKNYEISISVRNHIYVLILFSYPTQKQFKFIEKDMATK